MRNAHRILFFLKSFSIGILMPVTSLILLSRGASLNNLTWIIGVCILTVVVMEFPSGVFCDLFGRKRTFLISCLFMLLSSCILLLFPNITGAVIGLLFQGLAQAFASGSLDALIIEQGIEKDGEAALAKINGEFGVLESIGIASGSLFGGLLAGIGNQYSGNLICKIILYILITFLVIFCIRENSRKKTEKNSSLQKQAAESISFTWHTPKLMILMILVFVTGIIMFTVETYWQPVFTTLPGSNGSWKLGVITCCGFACTALGSQFISKLLLKVDKNYEKRWWLILFSSKLIFSLFVILFAAKFSALTYVFAYSLIYFSLGSSSVAENSLLGKLVPDHLRASIMSLFSLFFQSGALISAGISSILVTTLEIHGLWILAGCISVLVIVLLGIIYFYHTRLHTS